MDDAARGSRLHRARRSDAATARYEEAVAVARRSGDPLRLAHAIRHLGDTHRRARRLTEAEACYDEALALYAAIPIPAGVAESDENLARLG